MTKIKDVLSVLEALAPTNYQESYDNSGLIVGEYDTEIMGVLISLDCTESIIDEAIKMGCNLVVAHHPIVFKGLKRFNNSNYVEKTVIKAIKNDIAIYAIHTNLDNATNGVNFHIAQRLGLEKVKILSPKKQILKKLVTFCPKNATEKILNALAQAGAGQIGNYANCSFVSEGIGRFMPTDAANPFIGEKNKLEKVEENKIEVIFPSTLENKVKRALFEAHPYEEVSYDIFLLENYNQEVGAGAFGQLKNPMKEADFLKYLKEKMEVKVIKHTALLGKLIETVAVCGGAGIFLLGAAMAQKADIFITADVKYHEFFDTENRIILADIGHYESEIFTKDLIFKVLSEKFSNIALKISQVNTNPVQYFV